MQDDEYIPHGEDIEAFLKREIAKPIIRWEDSPQLGYEILPNKYFYRYQPPTPAKDLLAEFWKLEKEAEKMLEGLATMKDATDLTVIASPEYRQFIEDLKARVVSARISAARAVNRDGILLYWDIGRASWRNSSCSAGAIRSWKWSRRICGGVSAEYTGFSPRNMLAT